MTAKVRPCLALCLVPSTIPFACGTPLLTCTEKERDGSVVLASTGHQTACRYRGVAGTLDGRRRRSPAWTSRACCHASVSGESGCEGVRRLDPPPSLWQCVASGWRDHPEHVRESFRAKAQGQEAPSRVRGRGW